MNANSDRHDKPSPNDVDLAPEFGADEKTERISQAIVEFVAAAEAGKPLDRADLCSRYADVADELAACLATFDFMQNIAPQLADSAEVADAHRSPTLSPLATLGDFRILSELGRGGMGVVYEAEQLSLGRRMAVKVLPFAAMLDEQQLQRFKNEARAAATLDHPNIVAVHSVGQERGVHYYAMQLIDGQSLAEVIKRLRTSEGIQLGKSAHYRHRHGDRSAAQHRSRERRTIEQQDRSSSSVSSSVSSSASPDISAADTRRDAQAVMSTLADFQSREYFRMVARLGLQAAQALDHAHENGIVHRDVKPGNLLIDATAHLWVTDFGLARLETDAGITKTGDQLGTLAYMSPEQALAKRGIVDHRADIYSLGATLYELLTLRTPYAGRDRQQLLHSIATDEPEPLRQINSRIPEDLQTIVTKAIEKSPDDRYSTAAELAEDLQRFLAEQPIAAKRPNWQQRLTKWMRRNQGRVAGSLLVMSLLAVASLTATVMIWHEQDRTRAALDQARQQRTLAEQQQRLAEENAVEAQRLAQRAETFSQVAQQTIDEFLTQFASELEAQPDVGVVSQRMYLRAMEMYKRLLAQPAADPELQFKAAKAFGRAAQQLGALGQFAEARELLELAADRYRVLSHNDRANTPCRIELARVLNGLAQCAGMQLDSALAIKLVDEALTVLRPPSGDAYEIERLARMADCHHTLGWVYSGLSAMAAADSQLAESAEYCEKIVQQRQSDEDIFLFARVLCKRALVAQHANRGSQSEQFLIAALDLLNQRVIDPERHRYLVAFRLCEAELHLANFYTSTGQFDAALQRLEEAIAKLLELRSRHSEQQGQTTLEWCYVSMAELQFAMGDLPAAEQYSRRSLSSTSQAFAENSDEPFHRRERGYDRYLLGDLLYAMGLTVEGTDLLAAAREDLESVQQTEQGGRRRCVPELIRYLALCPDARYADPQRAAALIHTWDVSQSGPLTQLRAIAQLQAGHYRQAIATCQAAMALRAGGDAVDWLIMALALAESGDLQQAATWYDKQADAPSPQSPIHTLNCTLPQFHRLRQHATALLERK